MISYYRFMVIKKYTYHTCLIFCLFPRPPQVGENCWTGLLWISISSGEWVVCEGGKEERNFKYEGELTGLGVKGEGGRWVLRECPDFWVRRPSRLGCSQRTWVMWELCVRERRKESRLPGTAFWPHEMSPTRDLVGWGLGVGPLCRSLKLSAQLPLLPCCPPDLAAGPSWTWISVSSLQGACHAVCAPLSVLWLGKLPPGSKLEWS